MRFRRDAEYHAANPQVVKALQQASQSGEQEDYPRYAELVQSRPPTSIRDLLALRQASRYLWKRLSHSRTIVRAS